MKSAEVIKKLKDAGFSPRTGKGSHLVFTHADGRRTTVPNHKGEDIAKGTLKAIEKQSGIKMK